MDEDTHIASQYMAYMSSIIVPIVIAIYKTDSALVANRRRQTIVNQKGRQYGIRHTICSGQKTTHMDVRMHDAVVAQRQ